jgi:uncharacterized membrane protein
MKKYKIFSYKKKYTEIKKIEILVMSLIFLTFINLYFKFIKFSLQNVIKTNDY